MQYICLIIKILEIILAILLPVHCHQADIQKQSFFVVLPTSWNKPRVCVCVLKGLPIAENTRKVITH